jgi:hypothetical protein
MKYLKGITKNTWLYTLISILMTLFMIFGLMGNGASAQCSPATTFVNIPPSLQTNIVTTRIMADSTVVNGDFLAQSSATNKNNTTITYSTISNELADPKIEPIPDSPTLRTGTANFNQDSIALTGTLFYSGVYNNIRASFEYGGTTDYGRSTPLIRIPCPGPFSIKILVVKPGITYHYRAKAMLDNNVV